LKQLPTLNCNAEPCTGVGGSGHWTQEVTMEQGDISRGSDAQ